MFNVKVDTAKMTKIISETPKRAEIALGMVAEEIVTDIKLSMQASPPTGRKYRRRSITHTASSAGNPPRPDTGALMGSIRHQKAGRLTEHIMDGVEHGFYQEVLYNRPWMRPAMERIAPRVPDMIGRTLKLNGI